MKTLITAGLAAASVALIGPSAMAAPSPANPVPRYMQSVPAHGWQGRTPLDVAARRPLPAGRLNVDVAQFVRGMLSGGPVPYANLVRDIRSMHGSGGGTYDSSFSPTYSTDTATNGGVDEAALAQQENQNIQELNDSMALTASMAAAEEQNDEANAAALQTEINAGM